MKILIVGCGSIGKRHIKNLKSFLKGNILACDLNESRLVYVRKKYGIDTYKDYDKALSRNVDCVIVCTPTSTHVNLARKALAASCHVFIEKPLSDKMEGVDELIRLGKKNNKIISVGYNLRFDKCLRKVKEWLNTQEIGKVVSVNAHFGYSFLKRKPDEDYREDYAGKTSMGGGVILDVSHEIDYLMWLIGEAEEVFCYSSKVSQLDIDIEDLAEIFLKFKNNVISSIHLDFIQLPYHRFCRIIGRNGIIDWNFAKGIAKLYNVEKDKWKIYRGDKDWNIMYLEEIKHFIKCVEGKEKNFLDGKTGKKVLEVALTAKKSSRSRRIIKI